MENFSTLHFAFIFPEVMGREGGCICPMLGAWAQELMRSE